VTDALAPLDADTVNATYQLVLTHVRDALRENWSLPEFEQRLRSDGDVPHAELLLRFFKANAGRMRDAVAASHVWNDTLGPVAWRVDVKTKSRKVQELSEPTAIFELAVAHGAMSGSTKKPTSTVRFEMNKAQVVDVVRQLAEIERLLADPSAP
jgi:hypothetical protein